MYNVPENLKILNILKLHFLKNLNSFRGQKDAFDCAGIRTQVFRLPVEIANVLFNDISISFYKSQQN